MQSSKEEQEVVRKPSSAINKEIEENNRMGKTRDLFKKIRDTKGTCKEGQKCYGQLNVITNQTLSVKNQLF